MGGDDAESPNPTVSPTAKSSFDSSYSDTLVEGWLTVSNARFKDSDKYPIFTHPDGKAEILTSGDYTRINSAYKDRSPDEVGEIHRDEGSPPGRSFFYFRLNRQFLYFSETKTCVNVLGRVDWKNKVKPLSIHFMENPKCFHISENTGDTIRYCGKTHEDAKKFVCIMQTLLRVAQDDYCQGRVPDGPAIEGKPTHPPVIKPGQLVEKIITQPYILIPLAREQCNEHWDYANNGGDWKCLCKEGSL